MSSDAVVDFAMRKGEGLCCSVDCESSESESSREAGRRMEGVRGGGEDEGMVNSQSHCRATSGTAGNGYATKPSSMCRRLRVQAMHRQGIGVGVF